MSEIDSKLYIKRLAADIRLAESIHYHTERLYGDAIVRVYGHSAAPANYSERQHANPALQVLRASYDETGRTLASARARYYAEHKRQQAVYQDEQLAKTEAGEVIHFLKGSF